MTGKVKKHGIALDERRYVPVRLDRFTQAVRAVLLKPLGKSLYENKRPSRKQLEQGVKLVRRAKKA